MANTLTHFPAPSGAVLGTVRMVGAIVFKLVTTETYATPTGFTITAANWATILADAGIETQVKWGDVLYITGKNSLGYRADFTLVSDGTATVRMWNGATEIGDGAISTQGTITGILFFSPGSPS